MKAIILSAGQGSRLGHLTADRPKCLIEFAGRTLLDRQLDTLDANGIDQAVVVTGFHDDLVEAAIAPPQRRPERHHRLQPVLQGRRQHRLAVHGARAFGRRLPGVERRHVGRRPADGQGRWQRPRRHLRHHRPQGSLRRRRHEGGRGGRPPEGDRQKHQRRRQRRIDRPARLPRRRRRAVSPRRSTRR